MVEFPWSRDDTGDSPEEFDEDSSGASGPDTGDAPGAETGDQGAVSESDRNRQGDGEPVESVPDEAATVTCEFQDGTLRVFDDVLCIERPGRSKFSDKWIALNQVRGVNYQRRLVISYLQIEQVGFQLSDEGILSTPVDENTLHFGRGKRDCAQRATDEILDRMETV